MAGEMTRTLKVVIIGQAQSAVKGFKDTGDAAEKSVSKLDKFKAGLDRASVAAGAVAAAAAVFAKQAIGAAADLEQSIGGVDAVFKDSADTIHGWAAAAAESMGLSRNAYNEFATVVGSQLKNAGVPMDELAGKTDGLIALGADLAAMFGGTTADAVGAISSALKGEMDPIERYGISLNQAAIAAQALSMGLVDNVVDADKVRIAQDRLTLAQNKYNDALRQYGADSDKTLQASVALQVAQNGLETATAGVQGQLDAAGKAAAIQALLFAQSGDAQDAFARESDTLATKQQVLSAQWENLQATLGEKLLPIMVKVTDKLSQATEWVVEHQDAVTIVVGVIGSLVAIIWTLNAALRAWSVIQGVVNVLMSANPIGLIILGIAALIAIIVLLIANWDTVKAVAGKAWDWIKEKAVGVWEWLKGLPGRLMDMGRSLVNALTWPYRTAFNAIASMWNNTVGQLSWTVPSWVPGIGGNTVGAPKLPMIPALAGGGHLDAGQLAIVGERGWEFFVPDVSGTVIPHGESAGALASAALGHAGGGVAVTVNVDVHGNVTAERDLARSIARTVRDEIVRNGKRNGGKTGI